MQAELPSDAAAIVTYLWEIDPGRIVGRMIRSLDDISWQMEKSKVSQQQARSDILRADRNRIIAQFGFETEPTQVAGTDE